MSVTFAAVTQHWARVSLKQWQREEIKNALSAHGRGGCRADGTLPMVEIKETHDGIVVACLFHQVIIEFICNADARKVRVTLVKHLPINDRRTTYKNTPALRASRFMARRDRALGFDRN